MTARATILIVDDEPDVREVLDEYFVSHGYAVLCAENSATARELAAAQPIDLALVDVHMPGEDGLSLARHLRERYAQIAIVMLWRWAPTTTCPSLLIRASLPPA
jgi:two-component system phosphate regulon response regulator OmpR